jgi:hypothetical protein
MTLSIHFILDMKNKLNLHFSSYFFVFCCEYENLTTRQIEKANRAIEDGITICSWSKFRNKNMKISIKNIIT